ncbi:MAG: hypothetical protein WBB29_04235 [Geitlerinemataceae cyanobacterium]
MTDPFTIAHCTVELREFTDPLYRSDGETGEDFLLFGEDGIRTLPKSRSLQHSSLT